MVDSFEGFTEKVRQAIFEASRLEDEQAKKQILKFKFLAGDGRDKYIKLVERKNAHFDKNINVMRIEAELTPIVCESVLPLDAETYTVFSDERFKLLIKFCEGEELSDEQRKELFEGYNK